MIHCIQDIPSLLTIQNVDPSAVADCVISFFAMDGVITRIYLALLSIIEIVTQTPSDVDNGIENSIVNFYQVIEKFWVISTQRN